MLTLNGSSLRIYIVSLPHLLCPSSTSSPPRLSSTLCSLFNQLHLHCYDFQSSSLSTFNMHFSTFLTAAAATALCATSASAGCFNTGEHWGSHGDAKTTLAAACGEITGTFTGNQGKTVCRNAPTPNLSYVFTISNGNGGDVSVSQSDCEANIGGIIDNCGHGGADTINGVEYRYI